MFVLPTACVCDKIIPIKDGWVSCPICSNRRLKKIRPSESADLVYVHCRVCKNDIPLTLKQGQCFQSQSQRVV